MANFQPIVSLDGAKEANLQYVISAADLAQDLKMLLKDFYTATFEQSDEILKISFNNGQTFTVSVAEK